MPVLAKIDRLPNGYITVDTRYDEEVTKTFHEIPGCDYSKAIGAWRGGAEAMEIAIQNLVSRGLIVPLDLPARQPGNDSHGRLTYDDSKLYDYQKSGVEFIVQSLHRSGAAFLADGMGLGKSVQALRAAAAINPLHTVILCPAVVAPNWVREVDLWLGQEAVRFDGAKTKKASKACDHWKEAGGFAVSSYDSFRSRATGDLPADLVILDEIHYLSNPTTARSKAVSKFLNLKVRRPMTIALSGTPMLVRTRDLWHPLDLLWPGRFGRKFYFERRYSDGRYVEIKGLENPVWEANGASNIEELGKRLQPLMLRRIAEDVLDLPQLQRIMQLVDIPAGRLHALNRATAAVNWQDATSVNRVLSAIEEHKIKAAIELVGQLREAGHKVLVYTTRRETARELGEALKAPYVTGEDEVDTRRELLVKGAVEVGAGVATLYSVTTGINLVEFDTVVFVGLDWVPATMLQAEARIRRIGQTKRVMIYYLIGQHTLDEAVQSVVIERLETFSDVVGAAANEDGLAATLRGPESRQELIAAIMERYRKAA